VGLFLASRNSLQVQAAWGEAELETTRSYGPDECWAIRRGQQHCFRLRSDAPDLACPHLPSPPPSSALCIPLLADGQLLGALHLGSSGSDAVDMREQAAVVAEQISLALANLQLKETLRNQSIRDPLTGLFNRRYLEETLDRELSRAEREKTTLSVLALDVDHFKRFNDTFGHEAGDQVLKQVGALLLRRTRAGDVASRIGGEELVVVLPGAALEAASKKAESIRSEIGALVLTLPNKAVGPVTVSIGIAVFPEHATSREELMRVADAALYRAKHAGRNRSVAAE
jgi:diguanylate cyclase (GGDEF)-like protein